MAWIFSKTNVSSIPANNLLKGHSFGLKDIKEHKKYHDKVPCKEEHEAPIEGTQHGQKWVNDHKTK